MSACGYIYGDNGLIKSQEYDYLQAKQTKELSIPENLEHKNKANFTVVPKVGQKASQQPVGKDLAQVAPIQLLAVLDNTRVDKKSSIPAVFIMDEREFIWKSVELFLENNQIKIDTKNDQNIITDWIAIDEDGIWLGLDGSDEIDLIRAKFKISVEAGNLPGEHKLTVQRSESEIREDDDLPWNKNNITWQESADMMNMVLSFYDTQVKRKEAEHQQKIMAGFKVELGQNSDGEASLLTNADETIVWQKIPRVMRELGMTIIERDLTQKIHFMEYKTEEEGFFASLFESSSDVDGLFEDGAYQIVISENGSQRAITLKDGQGVALEASKLVSLFPELSRLFGDRR